MADNLDALLSAKWDSFNQSSTVAPSASSDLDSLLSQKWEAAQPKQQPLSANQISLGRLASAGQGGFGGFLEEAGSGVQALGGYLGALTSGNQDNLSLSDIYQEKLAQNRAGYEQYKQSDPTMSTALEIGGSLLSPINKVAAGGKGVLGIAKAGAIQSGIYGAGNAEGGIEDTVTNTLKSAATGGVLSGAFGTAGKLINSTGQGASKLAKSTENNLFGIGYGDIKKSLNKDIRARGLDIDDSPIEKAVERLAKNGVIKPGDYVDNLKNVETSIESLSEDLGGLYKTIDEVQQDFIEPTFSHVDEFLKKLDPTSKKQMITEFNKLKADQLGNNLSYSQWADTASSLNKQGANTLGLQGSDAFTPELKKFMARDINEALQVELNKPIYRGMKEQVIRTKGGLSDGFKAQEVLGNAAARDKSQTADSFLTGLIRTSGGYGVPMLAGAYAGNESGLGVLPGAIAGLALRTDAGKKGLVKAFNGISSSAQPIGSMLNKGAVGINRGLSPVISTQFQSDSSQTSQPAQSQLGQQNNQTASSSPYKSPLSRSSADILNSNQDQLSAIFGTPKNDSTPVAGDNQEVTYDPIFEAMVRAESGGNPNAVSPVGARGIAQLMPETAKEVLTEMFGRAPTKEDLETALRDPVVNKFMGNYYFSKMLKIFGGDQVLAVAAYNAGPGAVKKYGGIPPYKETQDYVRKVFRYAQEGQA